MQQVLVNKMQELAQLLVAQNKIISIAESCTGGMLSELLTSLAGSSQWFDRAFITYSNDAKIEMLGVKEATLMSHGAVSAACIEEMVLGALQNSHAQLSVAISGIAGPSGGCTEKPVGTVWIAWAGNHIPFKKQKFLFEGDRQSIRQQACLMTLDGMIESLNNITADEDKQVRIQGQL